MALPSGRYGLAKDWVDKVTGAFKKDKLLPWMKRGKWFTIHITSNGESFTVIESDLPVGYIVNNNGYINIYDFHIIKTEMDCYSLTDTSFIQSIFVAANKKTQAQTRIPTPAQIRECYLYIFGYLLNEPTFTPTLLSNDTVATQSVTSARKVAKAQVVEPTEEETIIEQPTDEG